jgi:hypothetical protein
MISKMHEKLTMEPDLEQPLFNINNNLLKCKAAPVLTAILNDYITVAKIISVLSLLDW